MLLNLRCEFKCESGRCQMCVPTTLVTGCSPECSILWVWLWITLRLVFSSSCQTPMKWCSFCWRRKPKWKNLQPTILRWGEPGNNNNHNDNHRNNDRRHCRHRHCHRRHHYHHYPHRRCRRRHRHRSHHYHCIAIFTIITIISTLVSIMINSTTGNGWSTGRISSSLSLSSSSPSSSSSSSSSSSLPSSSSSSSPS